MITFYKAHKGDYYCRELKYRIFKCGVFWRVQNLNGIRSIELYADSFQEAKNYLNQKMANSIVPV